MIIYPAIDICRGNCVRLWQGDYTQETVYSSNPLAVAKKFAAEGANWLHLVDLDAAKNPSQSQSSLIAQLIKTCGLQIQIGGGIRTEEQVRKLLAAGATRIIIGSMAVNNPKEVTRWLKLFGSEKLVLSLDIIYDENKQPMLTTDAWQNITKHGLFELVEYYQSASLQHILCTNVMLDGTLSGPDYLLYEELLKRFPHLNLQASGGIQSLSDIKLLQKKGLGGAIIGRALYENKFTLPEVLVC